VVVGKSGASIRSIMIGALAFLVVVAGCSGDDSSSSSGSPPGVTTEPNKGKARHRRRHETATTVSGQATSPATEPGTAPPAPPPAGRLAGVKLALEPFVDLPLLTSMAVNPADDSVYFSSQTGEIWRVADSDPELVLDLTAEVSPYEEGSERGLLGIQFSPADGRLFVYYTDHDIDSHLVSFAVGADGRPRRRSQWEVLFIEQPGLGHKGGGMAFEPNGTLYLALGDGGGSNGRDAQDYSKLLGGIVRIVPRTDGPGYDIPKGNPYARDDSTPAEIWAKGLREPWGFWRDPATGDMWTADVGDESMEEIDRLPAGEADLNFGWYFIEGTQVNHEGAPEDAVGPVFAYSHGDIGPAAIGGRVYRGSVIPKLDGAYVFADMSGPFLAIGADDETVRLELNHSGIITGFGVLPDGELIVLTHQEGAFRLVPG
jgi:glucose/arabinose dehydrogenase